MSVHFYLVLLLQLPCQGKSEAHAVSLSAVHEGPKTTFICGLLAVYLALTNPPLIYPIAHIFRVGPLCRACA